MDVDGEQETLKKSPTPCESLWFPDGNVVLATDTLLFKVHKGVLSLQSSVFKDMFELATVDDSNPGQVSGGILPEVYESLPLVTLAGDEGKDVAHLLRAAYERRCVHLSLVYATCFKTPQTILPVITAPIKMTRISKLSRLS